MRTSIAVIAVFFASSCRPAVTDAPPDHSGSAVSEEVVASANKPISSEQSLRLEFPLSDGRSGTKAEFSALQALEDQIDQAIDAARAGELDGNEVGGGTFVIYTYGPDAAGLFRAIAPVLSASPHSTTCSVIFRPGPPGTAEVRLSFVEAVRRFKSGA